MTSMFLEEIHSLEEIKVRALMDPYLYQILKLHNVKSTGSSIEEKSLWKIQFNMMVMTMIDKISQNS